MSSTMPPAFVPVVGSISPQAGSYRLSKDYMTHLLTAKNCFSSTSAHHVHNVDRTVHLRKNKIGDKRLYSSHIHMER